MSLREAFFFDFDGVLADSVNVKTDAFASLFAQYGSDIEEKVIAYHLDNGGVTRQEKFRFYYNELLNKPLSDGELEQLCNEFSETVVGQIIASPEIPGSVDFLRRYSSKVSCFVVSATPDNELNVIIDKRGLGKYFKEILGSSHSKGQNLRLLIEKHSMNPEKSLFFGDAASDYFAAADHGVPFIGILPDERAPLLKVVNDIPWFRDFFELQKMISV